MTDSLLALLKHYGQTQLWQFADQLTPERRDNLRQQIEAIDFPQLTNLVAGNDKAVDWHAVAAAASPPPAVRLGQPDTHYSISDARQAGVQALRDGQVAMLLVAGGQGTRLGFDLPKGMFPIGPVSGRSLFQMLCDRLSAMSRRYGADIPLYIMTSPATDAATRDYFAKEDRCGLNADQLHFFCQGQMPAVDSANGHVLLAAKDEVALSPDGHGGIVAALKKSGSLDDARQRGVKLFYYAQIDNPLAELCDPALIGYHLLAHSELTTQVVRKRFAKEKVGNVVSIDGKVQIIEYSDLPDDIAQQTTPDGDLRLWAGNIAIHVFDLAFLEKVANQADSGLPFHRASKKVPHVDDQGQLVSPTEPNATKFERFVFDLLPMANNALVVESDAARVFAPVKNADGAAVDTPELAKAAILKLHRNWLEAAGARIDEGVRVEIHPGWALDELEVQEKIHGDLHLTTDTFLM
ncbi:MAG: UDPGP type 1 family protein [Pirellulaceae bacterium]|nr:UDPGP type 1 family protein [Pirellulaceae bacterium]